MSSVALLISSFSNNWISTEILNELNFKSERQDSANALFDD